LLLAVGLMLVTYSRIVRTSRARDI
jgi:hypothetical protein